VNRFSLSGICLLLSTRVSDSGLVPAATAG
jgi:hypothetical protein